MKKQHELEFIGLRKYLFWIFGSYSFITSILAILLALFIIAEYGEEYKKELHEFFIYDELGRMGKLYAYGGVFVGTIWGSCMWHYSKWTKDQYSPKKLESFKGDVIAILFLTIVLTIISFFTTDLMNISFSLVAFFITLYILLPVFLFDTNKQHE